MNTIMCDVLCPLKHQNSLSFEVSWFRNYTHTYGSAPGLFIQEIIVYHVKFPTTFSSVATSCSVMRCMYQFSSEILNDKDVWS